MGSLKVLFIYFNINTLIIKLDQRLKLALSFMIRGLYYNGECLKLFEKLNQINSEEYIYALYDCADISFALEDYDHAISFYEKAEELAIENHLTNDLLFGIYTNLMNIYEEKGYRDTVQFYKNKIKEV